MKKDNLNLKSPRPFQDIGTSFSISGWVPRSWLTTEWGTLESSISVEFLDINAQTFLGTSITINTRSLFSKFKRGFSFSGTFQLPAMINWSIASSQGRIILRLSGKKESTQSIFIPLILKEFEPEEGVDQGIIETHKKIIATIKQQEDDLKNYFEELQEIRDKFEHNKNDVESDNNSHISDWQIPTEVYKLLEEEGAVHSESAYVKEKELENKLYEKYREAIDEFRRHLAKGSPARIDGFVFIVYSNDHDKHFHVVHKGRGVNARFSFPGLELIDYKNQRNTISSKEEKKIREYLSQPEIFQRLEKEFSKRDNLDK